ncbi:MAG TPA: TRAP transporter substrate-binding protein DctP [Gaiellaceae bacterium]|nr:TRAP transporter substrate-binding protein DctP [Gaiellaceae bacterium]
MNVKAAAGALVVLVSAATLAGTASPGRSTAPVTLKIAIRDGDFGGDPAAGDFVSRVQRLSHGALQLEVESYWGSGAHDAEQQLVRAVSTGKVDLGIVGTRAMDELGVRSFQALTAPLLVDSYPLERAVIASPIPGRMLAGLAPLKLTGLGVLGEGLRKPVAVKAPLLGPDSWRGVTFAAFRSRAAAATVRALGARASDVWGDALSTALTNGRVQGAENDLITYYTNDRQAQAPYVTANVNLWPRTEVVFANAASLGKLTSEQQGWLRAAAAGAAAASTERWDHDGQLAAELCKAGAHLVNASPADLAALRTSLAPVYASLGRDPQTRAFLARIEAMKRGVHTRPLAFPAGCSASPASLNGTYRVSWTEQELAARGVPSGTAHGDFGFAHGKAIAMTMTLRDGTFRIQSPGAPWSPCPGTYSVAGRSVSMDEQPPRCGGNVAATWSLAAGQLRLKVSRASREDAVVFGGKPWQKIG